jgi:O-antigen biosynthesis protein
MSLPKQVVLQRPVPILLYHSIGRAVGKYARWSIPETLFAEQLDALTSANIVTLTVSGFVDAVECNTLPSRFAVVTFDDGLVDFQKAVPYLESFMVKATLFVTSGFLGSTSQWLEPLGEGQRPMLSANDLIGLPASIEIGAHGHTHRPLDTCSSADRRLEISQSRESIENLLQRPVRTFAYPHGYESPRVRRDVKLAGFDSACGVGDRFGDTTMDRFALHRKFVTPDMSADVLCSYILAANVTSFGLARSAARMAHRIVRYPSENIRSRKAQTI